MTLSESSVGPVTKVEGRLSYLDDPIVPAPLFDRIETPYQAAKRWMDFTLPVEEDSPLEFKGTGEQDDPFMFDKEDGSMGFAYEGSFPPDSFYDGLRSPFVE